MAHNKRQISYVQQLVAPRLAADLRATREESPGAGMVGAPIGMMRQSSLPHPSGSLDEGSGPNLKRSLGPDVTDQECDLGLKIRTRIGCWNVRTMMEGGKLENVKQEMKRLRIGVLGLSETRWKGTGDFRSDDVRVMYSGGEESQRGVAILLDKEFAKRVIKMDAISDRLMLVKIKAEPVDMVVIQVYLPTSDYDDEEIEKLYEEIEEVMRKEKGADNLIVMGDWNAVVGEGRDEKEVGEFGLGVRNERGQMMVEFCKRMKMVITNTWFEQNKRHRYTWKSPGDRGRFQLDYILVRQRYRNSVKVAKSYPGADANTDHNLVLMEVHVRLKKIKRGKRRMRWQLDGIDKKVDAFQKEFVNKWKGGPGTRKPAQEKWDAFKLAVVESAKVVVGYQKSNRAKKPWITQEMLGKMDERRKWKNVNTDVGKQKYKELNKELKKETDNAREKWWMRECEELEELDRRGRTHLMYTKIKQITRTGKGGIKSGGGVMDSKGTLLTEKEDMKERWKEYVEMLYDKDGKPVEEELGVEKEMDVEVDSLGPELLASEIEAAIKEMKNGKAVGIDEIPAEFLKALGGEAEKHMTEMCQEMYRSGCWPDDFKKVIMIPLPKKQNATECSDHRTISLISHASKIMLKILMRRIEGKADSYIGDTQFGFRKGKGTRDAIGVMRMLCERSLELDNDVYICFVDFEKAFDRVNWIKMMEILKMIGVDWRDRRLIANLYMEQTAVVKVQDEYSKQSIIDRGVRQGCCLLPLLFSIYAEIMVKLALEGLEEGIKVGGRMVNEDRFADDQGMVESTEAGLQ